MLIVFVNPVFANEITQTDLTSFRPQIHSDGEKIFLVWTERSETNAEIYFSKSIDEGLTFSKPLNISNNPGSSAFPRMAINENDIFVTWYDYSQGQSDVMLAKSTDAGETFTSFNISDNITASYNPWIAADSNFVYLVWNDGGKSQEIEIDGKSKIVDVLVGNSDIMFGTSSDKGQTFEVKNISKMAGDSINARMKIDNTNIYLVWTDRVVNSEIFFSKSNDSSSSFSKPVNISKSDAKSFDAGIQIYDQNVFLVWTEQNDKGTEIYFSKSNDEGNSFSNPISLSGESGDYKITRDTQIDTSYPHLYVVYYDKLNSDVYLAHSPNMGETFFDSTNLSLGTGKTIFPQLVTNENRVSIIWNDEVDGNKDVYLRESIDYGYTFGPKINISNNENDSEIFILGPQISKSEKFINIIWENKTDSKSDLFLKQESIKSTPLSFSDNDVEISLEGYEIQPGKETQIELKFLDWKNSDIELQNHFLTIIDSEKKTIFESTPSLDVNGSAKHTVIFPEPGQYSLKLNFKESIVSEDDEILITVIPEFEFVIFVVLSLSISMIIFTKRIQPRVFN